MKNVKESFPVSHSLFVLVWMRGHLLILAAFILLVAGAHAEEDEADTFIGASQAALRAGKTDEAYALAGKAIVAAPKRLQPLLFRAKLYEKTGEHEKAIADYSAALKFDTATSRIYQERGQENFRAGHIKESIADFDEYIKQNPEAAPHHWQRGIALYYAGRFDDGKKQFEIHKTVNPNDVENAVWHFLCNARATTPEKARAELIKIENDGRVPMMQIYALFKGDLKPDDVLAAAKANNPSPTELEEQLFYAHLYLGIYFEALGDNDKAREHIFKSVNDYKSPHYMGDVARVHAAILKEKK